MPSTKDRDTGSYSDEDFMRAALQLAGKGEGWVSPNPMVGAVVVRGGKIISSGYHRRFGGPHAEVEALSRVENGLQDATLYVTLEPCCHYGKTPPCTDLILKRGLARVVVGALDPSPQVGGRGIQTLRESGIAVWVGVLEEACRKLNRTYFHWREQGLPWVTLKWAQSLDGRIATSTGHSQWITSQRSRKTVHRLRARHDAILVGIGTVLRDDPMLTVRHGRGRDPIRIILDTRLKIPFQSKVLERQPKAQPTWVATTDSADSVKARDLENMGIRILRCPEAPSGGVDIAFLLKEMADDGIASVLVEGGSKVLTSFIKSAAVQRMVCFVAPILLGSGVDVFDNLGILRVDQALRFGYGSVKRLGEDLMIDVLMRSANPNYS
jgi:diaminohydroxyphosphoribosylaminopyrimidine deaminase/5-amino-6-(5-phosphoribosylamino)uracil reductase